MLHGEIKVNHKTIGWWSAVRKEEVLQGLHGADDLGEHGPFFRYACEVEYTDMGGYTLVADFDIVHRFGDGALLLAVKVIERGNALAKRVGPRE